MIGRDLCLGTLIGLPQNSAGWRSSLQEQLELLTEHQIECVVAWDHWDAIQSAGLGVIGMARLLYPNEALDVALRHRDSGLAFSTVHAGTGFETDDEMSALAVSIVKASQDTGYPLHVETHRATMTQDIFRTLRLLEQHPDLMLTLDFSHWYTGHEMTYGGEFEDRLQKASEAFRNVGSLQLRLGNSCTMQLGTEEPGQHKEHFAMALRSCFTKLRDAGRIDRISVAPELLPYEFVTENGAQEICYAEREEKSDRFADALSLLSLAEREWDALKA